MRYVSHHTLLKVVRNESLAVYSAADAQRNQCGECRFYQKGTHVKQMVAIVGGDPCTSDEYNFAHMIGAYVASRRQAVVTGGRGGVMEAASRGAHEAGGLTIGILPNKDLLDANQFLDIAIPSGMGELRNGLIVAAAGVVIAVGGEYGTLSEISLALKAGKPVIGWHTWRLDSNSKQSKSIIAVASIEEACEEIERALQPGNAIE